MSEGVITESRMTEFGKYLYALMLKRGIEFKGDLVDMLVAGGYPMSRSRLSFYLSGHRTVPWVFVRCVEELLELSQSERGKLERLHIEEYVAAHTKLSEEQREIVAGFSKT